MLLVVVLDAHSTHDLLTERHAPGGDTLTQIANATNHARGHVAHSIAELADQVVQIAWVERETHCDGTVLQSAFASKWQCALIRFERLKLSKVYICHTQWVRRTHLVPVTHIEAILTRQPRLDQHLRQNLVEPGV